MQCCVILSITSAQLYGSKDEETARDKREKPGPWGWVSNAVSLCCIISQAQTHSSQYYQHPISNSSHLHASVGYIL